MDTSAQRWWTRRLRCTGNRCPDAPPHHPNTSEGATLVQHEVALRASPSTAAKPSIGSFVLRNACASLGR